MLLSQNGALTTTLLAVDPRSATAQSEESFVWFSRRLKLRWSPAIPSAGFKQCSRHLAGKSGRRSQDTCPYLPSPWGKSIKDRPCRAVDISSLSAKTQIYSNACNSENNITETDTSWHIFYNIVLYTASVGISCFALSALFSWVDSCAIINISSLTAQQDHACTPDTSCIFCVVVCT